MNLSSRFTGRLSRRSAGNTYQSAWRTMMKSQRMYLAVDDIESVAIYSESEIEYAG